MGSRSSSPRRRQFQSLSCALLGLTASIRAGDSHPPVGLASRPDDARLCGPGAGRPQWGRAPRRHAEGSFNLSAALFWASLLPFELETPTHLSVWPLVPMTLAFVGLGLGVRNGVALLVATPKAVSISQLRSSGPHCFHSSWRLPPTCRSGLSSR